jgi:hypothetical protein
MPVLGYQVIFVLAGLYFIVGTLLVMQIKTVK